MSAPDELYCPLCGRELAPSYSGAAVTILSHMQRPFVGTCPEHGEIRLGWRLMNDGGDE